MTFDKDFKKNFKIEGFHNPVFFTSTVDYKKYAVSGTNWIEVPSDMTIEEVRKGFIDRRIDIREKLKADFTKEVPSSKGKTKYKVSFVSGAWKCNCSGFNFRKKCAHIDSVKLELKSKISL